MTGEQASQGSRVVRWLVNGLLGLAIVMVVLIVVPALFGYSRYVIDGHSMETAIPYASVAYEQKVPVGDLKVGDVITFAPPPEYNETQLVTHRIVEISSKDGTPTFRTKGDNNDSEDPWTITMDQPTQPRVKFHVPYVGYFYILLSIWWVRFLLIALPALAIAIWIVVALWKEAGREMEKEKEKRRREVSNSTPA